MSKVACHKVPSVAAHNRSLQDIESGVEIPLLADESGRSFAIRRLSPTRVSVMLVYAVVVLSVWLLAIAVPFYAWIPLVAALTGAYRWAICADDV